MAEQRIGALVLSAGFSSRMNEFKPLLELDGKTLLEHAIGLFKAAGIENITTVLGHRAEELPPILESASSTYVINENYQDGMFSSIQCGVRELRKTSDAFFLLPVDIPFVRPTTIRRLLEEFHNNTAAIVCYPQFRERRGHPPLINSSIADEILAYDGNGGMRELLGKYRDQAVMVTVDDPFTLMDIDTEKDFNLLQDELFKTFHGAT